MSVQRKHQLASDKIRFRLPLGWRCCQRLKERLAALNTDGPEQVEIPCAKCGTEWIVTFDGSHEQARQIIAEAAYVATRTGKVCLHQVGEIVEGRQVTEDAACPCGKQRFGVSSGMSVDGSADDEPWNDEDEVEVVSVTWGALGGKADGN